MVVVMMVTIMMMIGVFDVSIVMMAMVMGDGNVFVFLVLMESPQQGDDIKCSRAVLHVVMQLSIVCKYLQQSMTILVVLDRHQIFIPPH